MSLTQSPQPLLVVGMPFDSASSRRFGEVRLFALLHVAALDYAGEK